MFLLLLVKMTVSSGTINGLIFYANIQSFSGLLDYQECSIHPILRVFLSWINLDFGIEVCLYSGMDVYKKNLAAVCLSLLHLVPGGCHHPVLPLFLHCHEADGNEKYYWPLCSCSPMPSS